MDDEPRLSVDDPDQIVEIVARAHRRANYLRAVLGITGVLVTDSNLDLESMSGDLRDADRHHDTDLEGYGREYAPSPRHHAPGSPAHETSSGDPCVNKNCLNESECQEKYCPRQKEQANIVLTRGTSPECSDTDDNSDYRDPAISDKWCVFNWQAEMAFSTSTISAGWEECA